MSVTPVVRVNVRSSATQGDSNSGMQAGLGALFSSQWAGSDRWGSGEEREDVERCAVVSAWTSASSVAAGSTV